MISFWDKPHWLPYGVYLVADSSARSPWKSFNWIIWNNVKWVSKSPRCRYSILTLHSCVSVLADSSVRSPQKSFYCIVWKNIQWVPKSPRCTQSNKHQQPVFNSKNSSKINSKMHWILWSDECSCIYLKSMAGTVELTSHTIDNIYTYNVTLPWKANATDETLVSIRFPHNVTVSSVGVHLLSNLFYVTLQWFVSR